MTARLRRTVVACLAMAAAAGCGGSGEPSGPAAPVTVAPPDPATTTSTTSTSASTEPGTSRPSIGGTIPARGRMTVGPVSIFVPPGWTVEPGRDGTTIDGEQVKGGDSLCLRAPDTSTDGIPFPCNGVLVLTGTAFDNASEGQTPYDPDSAYQWYPGTDVPACEPDFPLVRSKVVESSLQPLGDKKAAFRRLEVRCEGRPTVHRAVSWTLPKSKVALVSLFRPDEARDVFASAQLR